MKGINENPFRHDTMVVPFSNGEQAEMWVENNCDECVKQSKCELENEISSGFIIGEIPLWVAKRIVCTYNPLYQTCELAQRCNEKRTGNEPF